MAYATNTRPRSSRGNGYCDALSVVCSMLFAWLAGGQFGLADTKLADSPAGGATAPGKAETADDSKSGNSLDEAIALAKESQSAVVRVEDYSAIFSKKEQVGKRLVEQEMDIKLRHKPFSVYLRARNGKESGREVIYHSGANAGKLLVHESGLKAIAGTLPFALNDPQVMEENRYPITEIGIAKILEKALTVWEREKLQAPQETGVLIKSGGKVGSRQCDVVEITHRRPRPDLKFSFSRVYFDKDSKLTVRAEQYGWPANGGEDRPLLEQYVYTDVKTNVGLTDDDFDPQNSKYAFGGGKQ